MHRHGLGQTRYILLKHTGYATYSQPPHPTSSKRPRPPLDIDPKILKKNTNRIIDRAARAPNQGWKHTKTLRGDEQRLKSSIRTTPNAPRPTSVESIQFQSSSPGEEVDLTDLTVKSGTFVEIRRNEISTHGVALGEEYVNSAWSVVSLISSGEVWRHRRADVMFVKPDLVSESLVARCGTAEITETKSEIMARIEVLKRMKDFEREVEAEYNALTRRSYEIYSQVKAQNPDDWSVTTVTEVAKLLSPLPDPQLATLFAVHKHLMNLNKHFVADVVSYRTTQQFSVRPQSHAYDIEAVTQMSRVRDGPIDSFARRARSVIESNQRRALESRGETPFREAKSHSAFTAEDRVIINFLIHSLRPKRTTQLDPYSIGTSAIMKKIEVYPGDVDDDMVYKALIDMGIFAPWEDLVSKRQELKLYQGLDEMSPVNTQQNALVHKYLNASKRNLDGDLSPEGFYSRDLLNSVRHDFGDMPVYVIDDPGAEELDDGISIEPSSRPKSYWIHVHVADPTAVIPPNHPFALRARQQTETAYFNHRTWPMLPQSLMKAKLSLGVTAAAGRPENVLSFSFEVDSKGRIGAYKVRAGLIRNIQKLDYDSVDLALGLQLPEVHFPFGGAPTSSAPLKIRSSSIKDLKDIYDVARRMVSSRLRMNVFQVWTPKCEISISPKPLAMGHSGIPADSKFRGFPTTSYSVTSAAAMDCGSRQLVSEMMKSACRVASRFCVDHQVPALRRTSGPILTESDSDMEELLTMRDRSGYVDRIEVLRREAMLQSAEYSVAPDMHWSLGVTDGEGYVRVTSPLRRYSDMVAHWQIKHALLASGSRPPFSEDGLRSYGTELLLKDKLLKRASEDHRKFWALLYLKRWEENPLTHVSNPLGNLSGIVVSPPIVNHQTKALHCKVLLPTLGIEGTLSGSSQELPVGTSVPVKVDSIRLGVQPVLKLCRVS